MIMGSSNIAQFYSVKKTQCAGTHHLRKYTHAHKHNLYTRTQAHTHTHTHTHTSDIHLNSMLNGGEKSTKTNKNTTLPAM